MFTKQWFYNKVFQSSKRCSSRWSDFCISILSCIRIFFLLIKNDSSIKSIKVFDYVFLYRAYADDSAFFLKDLSYNSKYSGLKPNFSNGEIAGIGSLKWVEVAVCGIKCLNLKVNTIKIFGIHVSYNNKLNMEKNFLAAISFKMFSKYGTWGI